MTSRSVHNNNNNNPLFAIFVTKTSWVANVSKTKSHGSLIFMSKDANHVHVQPCHVSSRLSKEQRFSEGERQRPPDGKHSNL